MSEPAASFGFKDVDPADKPGLVRGVFDRVARRYDLMNDLMSAGVHRLWKDAVAARLNPQPGEFVVDCAGGTGDLALRFAKMARAAQLRRGGEDAQVLVVDYNAEMIAAGRARGAPPEVVWAVGDASALPLPDARADAYVIAFGIRNVTDIDQALREARRVLKPGGRFLCLEFSRPTTEALRKAYDLYSFKVIPQVGEWVAGDRDAYQYLVESIRRFPDQGRFAEMMRRAGFGQVRWTNFTGGVAALHQGWALGRPMSRPATLGRLIAAAWVLIRADALIPRELDPILPPVARRIAGSLRLFSGRAAREGRPGQRLARALEHLGPAAIKLGQVLSTRADIFGRVFAEDLSRLKDQLAPFPTVIARQIIAADLDQPVEALFVSFGEPIAAASLAQAHPATLADGRAVAVKVLRPGIERRVGEDIEVLHMVAGLLETAIPLARRLEPRALAGIVARSLELELDLRLEAAGASELREVMALDGYMRAPPVVWAGVGKRVLTLGWAEGVALSDPAALDQPGIDRRALADNLVRAFLSQALDHGVFHADLHEGNLFVGPPGVITAVDFGIVGRLDAVARRHLAEILWGFLQRDYMRVAKAHFDAGYVPPRHSIEAFAQALRAVGEPNVGRPSGAVSMGRLLGLLFEITGMFDMHLRPELVLLQKTMVTVEGVARKIDPGHNLWAAAEPVVQRWIMRELSPATRLRELAGDAVRALQALARLADAPPTPPPPTATPKPVSRLLWFVIELMASGAAFLTAARLVHHP